MKSSSCCCSTLLNPNPFMFHHITKIKCHHTNSLCVSYPKEVRSTITCSLVWVVVCILITPRNIFALPAISSFSSLVCSRSQRLNLLLYTIITWYYLKPYINYKAYSTKKGQNVGKLSIFGQGSIIRFACLLTYLLDNRSLYMKLIIFTVELSIFTTVDSLYFSSGDFIMIFWTLVGDILELNVKLNSKF